MLIPEWKPQKGILMAWPAANTDWNDILEEAQKCYREIIENISKFSRVFLLVADGDESYKTYGLDVHPGVQILHTNYNDTWTRDYGPLAVQQEEISFLDLCFNGWGRKFTSEDDNRVNSFLHLNGILPNLENHKNLVLEGGSVESDGNGTILTTENCLLAPNRNQPMTRKDLDSWMKKQLGARKVLWLKNGYLVGDDTDGHIDTLARFCSPDTIAYVACQDRHDEHYDSLNAMEEELRQFTNADGQPYQLVPLPMVEAIYDTYGDRLPATYANFLIMEKAVIVPVYGVSTDPAALEILKTVFTDKEVVPVPCQTLIKQHGSLHCITMQLPKTAEK